MRRASSQTPAAGHGLRLRRADHLGFYRTAPHHRGFATTATLTRAREGPPHGLQRRGSRGRDMRGSKFVSLSRISRREAHEVSRTREYAGPAWNCAEKLVECVHLLADHLSERCAGGTILTLNKSTASSLFLRAAARTAAFEFLEIARRHWPESILKRRRTHELIAFAWIALRDRQAADRWISQRGDWDRYLRSFNIRVVPTALEELHPGEADRHKRLQRLAHPSLASLGPSIRVPPGSPVHRAVVELFDDQQHLAAGLVQVVKVERILDSVRQTHALLCGLLRRLARTSQWGTASHRVKNALDNLEWRLQRDVQHYRRELARLDEHRRKINARIDAKFETRSPAFRHRRAQLTDFFEHGSGEVPDLS